MKCRKCSQTISGEEEFLYDGETPLHIACYTCSQCQQSLAGRFYYRSKDPRDPTKKRLLCETCHFRLAPVCFYCLKIIEEISLTYGERVFHPRCFRCDQCQTPFDGALIFPYGTHLYCRKCYSQVQTDFQPISTDICRSRCERCRKQFQPADLITEHRLDKDSDVHYLHNSCFVCEICHENLSNAVYYSPKDPDDPLEELTFQCETCHQTASTICSICFQPADDRMMVLNHRWYHEHCFICRHCRYSLKNLTRVIIEPDGFSCERCLKSIRDAARREKDDRHS